MSWAVYFALVATLEDYCPSGGTIGVEIIVNIVSQYGPFRIENGWLIDALSPRNDSGLTNQLNHGRQLALRDAPAIGVEGAAMRPASAGLATPYRIRGC
jgi:hypothetical protein